IFLMGLLDGLTDTAFRTDSAGRQVFYPWGSLGKGYVMRDVEHYQSMRSKIKWMYIIILPLLFISHSVFGIKGNLICLALYLIWHPAMLKYWTSGLEISSERMTAAETRGNSAKSHNRGTLIFFVIMSVVFVLLGLWLIANGYFWQGLLSSIFFGGCGFMIALMLRDKGKDA
ncbi:MAG: hypothetical protein Q8K65_11515, partial [Alphaproteobacteria bacterium]|nr:hypothetical protein [Alphaproteobacteria bacterium]